VTPPLDDGRGSRPRVSFEEPWGDEHHARATVGHLTAVGATQSSFHDGVRKVVGVEARLGEVPLAGLGEGLPLALVMFNFAIRAQCASSRAVSQVVSSAMELNM